MVCNQTGAANEETVYAIDFEITGGGVFVDGAPIQNWDVGGGVGAIELGDVFANEAFGLDDVDWLGGLSVFVATDSPDWFVGNNNFIDVFFANFVQTVDELTIDGSASFAVFAFESGLTDAENWSDIAADGGGDFLGDIFFGFVEEIAAFGMADDGVIYEAAELGEGYFASVCAIIAPVEILSCELELAAVNLQRE